MIAGLSDRLITHNTINGKNWPVYNPV